MLIQLKEIASVQMPILFIANNMSPAMGGIMSTILLGMIYNTAVGMLYAFSARLVKPETAPFKGAGVDFGEAAFGTSLIGFITLVGTVYPVMGYLGLTLIAAIVYTWVKKRGSVGKGIKKVLGKEGIRYIRYLCKKLFRL